MVDWETTEHVYKALSANHRHIPTYPFGLADVHANGSSLAKPLSFRQPLVLWSKPIVRSRENSLLPADPGILRDRLAGAPSPALDPTNDPCQPKFG
jgi:hypothetical protein